MFAHGPHAERPVGRGIKPKAAVRAQDQARGIMQLCWEVRMQIGQQVGIAQCDGKAALRRADPVGGGVAHEIFGHEAMAARTDNQNGFVRGRDGQEIVQLARATVRQNRACD